MTDSLESPQLFLGDAESFDAAGPVGQIAVRSLKSPDKDGPNEDAAAVIPVGDNAVVLAVADGVGGSPAGCEASSSAMRILKQSLAKADGTPLRGSILDAIEQANRAIMDSGRRSATTLVVAEIAGHELRCYHIGDSELVLVGQRGRVKQRIIPHSPTGFAVEAGLLDEDEAVRHEERHVIFNVVGAPDMRVDVSAAIDIARRDTVLLASDGVLDNLYFDEIVGIIRVGPIARAADRLIEAARKRMANGEGAAPSKPDDATIVLYRRSV